MSGPVSTAWQRYRSVPLIARIFVAFLLGSAAGVAFGERMTVVQPLGDLFLRLLNMLVIPIIVFTLLTGIRQLSPARLGRIGGVTVGLYAVTTTIAGLIGLAVANLLQPGRGVEFTGGEAQSQAPPSLTEVVLGIVPNNPVAAMADGNLLATVFFVIVFGIALTYVRARNDELSDSVDSVFEAFEVGAEAMFVVVRGVLEFGVVGVFALMAAGIGTEGVGVFSSLGELVLAVAIAVVVHIAFTYLFVLMRLVVGVSPLSFLSGAKDAMVTAFATRSSSGTLPVTMRNAEEDLRISERVYSFALPVGATANMDGAAIRQAITVVFAANVVGQPLAPTEQVLVLVVAVLISIGTAGVPGAGLVMLTVVLNQVGLPLEVVGFVAGVDPILGRIATMNNVTGDLAVSTVVGKWNDALDLDGGVWSAVTDD
ncbi:SDF family transport protein (probable substrate glutamate/aspartate) [Halobacterium hubeiense]|uniref:SDF family transport protein (Probable substrate glutamate/aspartate) n=1 Tax=Halobacterium hubeiense TaxID=1407499 RepID=A0A0U5H2K7_9EURY|nr:dicarboxylate/amino acid:cation symporter [Halobacterium hubeiense]CQH57892.1 SDF family transport protein (probable substrate glutamate/aspartate) [Halobacterium hubeiense]